MKEKEDKAIISFNTGMNCAQAVLTTYADSLNFDKAFALSVSSGFGGGMGKLQETCGVVTGSFMALGIYNSQKYSDNIEARNKTNLMIQEFTANFKAIHGTMACKSLLNCDFKTEEGEKLFKDNNLKKNVCEKCMSDAIRLVEGLTGV